MYVDLSCEFQLVSFMLMSAYTGTGAWMLPAMNLRENWSRASTSFWMSEFQSLFQMIGCPLAAP